MTERRRQVAKRAWKRRALQRVWNRNAKLLRTIAPCGCIAIWRDGRWWWAGRVGNCGGGIDETHWSANAIGRPGKPLSPAIMAAAYGMALRDLEKA